MREHWWVCTPSLMSCYHAYRCTNWLHSPIHNCHTSLLFDLYKQCQLPCNIIKIYTPRKGYTSSGGNKASGKTNLAYTLHSGKTAEFALENIHSWSVTPQKCLRSYKEDEATRCSTFHLHFLSMEVCGEKSGSRTRGFSLRWFTNWRLLSPTTPI